MSLNTLFLFVCHQARHLCFGLMLISPFSTAACLFNDGIRSGNTTFTITPRTTLNPSDNSPRELGRVSISAASLASAMGASSDAKLWSGCSGNLIWSPLRATSSGVSPNSTGYIATGIKNLSLYMYAGSQTSGKFGPFMVPDTNGAPWSRSLSSIANTQPTWGEIGDVVLVLYQTGPIKEGGLIPAGPLAEIKLSDGLQIMNISLGAIEVNVSGCTLSSHTITVGMGGVLQREFTGTGSTVRKTPFIIDAQCDSGILPTMTFSGTSQASDSSVFALTNTENSAKGIGVQVNFEDNPVQNNEIIDLNRTTTNGLNSFPFSAHYIQTDPTVIAGKADATITFTLSYK